MNRRVNNILWWLLLAVICLGALAWRGLCPPTVDDFLYRLNLTSDGFSNSHISSWSDVFNSIIHHASIWNGRFANYFAYILLYLPHWFEVLFSSVLVASLPLLIYANAGGSMAKKNTSMLALCTLTMWLFCPWHDLMQSTDYLLNYVLSMDAVLVAMLLWRWKRTWQGRNWMWFFPLLLLCNWIHEAASCTFIAWAGIETLINLRGGFPLKKVLGWLCAVCGLLLILSSPNTSERMDDVQFFANKFSVYKLFCLSVVWIYFIIIVIFTLLPTKRLMAPKGQLLMSQLPLVLAIIACLTAIMNMVVGARVMFMPNILAIIGLMKLIHSMKSIVMESPYFSIALILLLAVFYTSLIRWTYFCREDFMEVQAEIKKTGSLLVFRNIHLKDDMPIWTLRIPQIQRYYDMMVRHEGFYAGAGNFHPIAVLPKAWEGKPREQWPTLPGLDDFYQLPDEGVIISTRRIENLELDVEFTDSIVADNALYGLKRLVCKAVNKGNKTKRSYYNPEFVGTYQGDSIFAYYKFGTSQFFEGRVLRHCRINENCEP